MFNFHQTIHQNVVSALQEDIADGDITAALIPQQTRLKVQLLCRETAILCGQKWFDDCFHQLDPTLEIHWLCEDGDTLGQDQVVCNISGPARPILSAERTALNFLQTLSATATVTHQFQSLIHDTGCKILDTRKTIPNLRIGQKYAVQCGGGMNHRIGLFDAFLLKENHLAAAGSLTQAAQLARNYKPEALLEIEVETLQQLEEAIAAGVDRVLLDNFSLDMLRQAVTINAGRLQLEASGNIDQHNIRDVANTGVNFISIGALTKHVRAIDFSLRYVD